MSNENQDKHEAATPQKLKKAREQGQVPKSQDFVRAISFAAGGSALIGFFPSLFQTLNFFLLKSFRLTRSAQLTDEDIVNLLKETIPLILHLLFPFGIILIASGTLVHAVQTGILFSTKVLNPDFNRIDPWKGCKNLFRSRKMVELCKNLGKTLLVSWLAYDVVARALYSLPQTTMLPLGSAVLYASQLLTDFLGKTMLIFIGLGAADLLWARWSFFKEQRMSSYERQQEHKQQEGDPQVKGQRRQIAHEILFAGGEKAVKTAHAVVTNPTHIAVAIRYDDAIDIAPKLVAKGTHREAEKIKSLALKHHIPIITNVPLARALHEVELDHEIPEELFEATAEVLAYVFRLR